MCEDLLAGLAVLEHLASLVLFKVWRWYYLEGLVYWESLQAYSSAIGYACDRCSVYCNACSVTKQCILACKLQLREQLAV